MTATRPLEGLGASLEPIVPEDDAVVHAATAHPDWREAWWFVFFDQRVGVHGVAYLYAYPNQDRGACLFGLWQGDRGLHLVRDFNVPLEPGSDVRSLAGLTVTCTEPHEGWRISYRAEGVRLDLDWNSITPPYEWEWGSVVGSRRFEQSGRLIGSVRVGDESWEIDGVGQRDRAWGPRSFAVVQQCWSSRIHFSPDFVSHQSIVTVGGRDCLFGYVLRDGRLELVESLDLKIAFAYPDGPPALTQAQLVDAAGRELSYLVTPVNVVSTVLAGVDRVKMHTTFSRFEGAGQTGIGHLDHWFSDRTLVRSHQAVRNRNLGRFLS